MIILLHTKIIIVYVVSSGYVSKIQISDYRHCALAYVQWRCFKKPWRSLRRRRSVIYPMHCLPSCHWSFGSAVGGSPYRVVIRPPALSHMPYGISVVSLTFTPPPMPISYVPTTNNPTHYHVPHGKKKKKSCFLWYKYKRTVFRYINVNFIFMLFSIAAL